MENCRRRLRPSKEAEGAQVMGFDEMHQQVLVELADDVTKPLSIISEKVVAVWKREKKKDLGTTDWSVSPWCQGRSRSRSSWGLL